MWRRRAVRAPAAATFQAVTALCASSHSFVVRSHQTPGTITKVDRSTYNGSLAWTWRSNRPKHLVLSVQPPDTLVAPTESFEDLDRRGADMPLLYGRLFLRPVDVAQCLAVLTGWSDEEIRIVREHSTLTSSASPTAGSFKLTGTFTTKSLREKDASTRRQGVDPDEGHPETVYNVGDVGTVNISFGPGEVVLLTCHLESVLADMLGIEHQYYNRRLREALQTQRQRLASEALAGEKQSKVQCERQGSRKVHYISRDRLHHTGKPPQPASLGPVAVGTAATAVATVGSFGTETQALSRPAVEDVFKEDAEEMLDEDAMVDRTSEMNETSAGGSEEGEMEVSTANAPHLSAADAVEDIAAEEEVEEIEEVEEVIEEVDAADSAIPEDPQEAVTAIEELDFDAIELPKEESGQAEEAAVHYIHQEVAKGLNDVEGGRTLDEEEIDEVEVDGDQTGAVDPYATAAESSVEMVAAHASASPSYPATLAVDSERRAKRTAKVPKPKKAKGHQGMGKRKGSKRKVGKGKTK